MKGIILITGSNLVLRLLESEEPLNIIGLDNLSDYYDLPLKEYCLGAIQKKAATAKRRTYKFIKGDLANKASCDFSIHNYECGSPELQAIYQAMLTTDGIYGGRFSGTGSKGARIALVDSAMKDSIEKEITEKNLAQFLQYRDSFKVFFCKSDDGARFV